MRAVVAVGRRENSPEATRIVRKQEEDDRLDQALIETFPASDPISPHIPSPPRKRFAAPGAL
ncbi:MAG: hypothetical protein J0I77_23245 [Rudaea sp.]|uniref:hypothetical protein n=1 Tax=unclassified Rudaea TaxID=2627037 RepID=UPI0010F84F05|nr:MULTISPECIES: hypothetical protein [unclassified Rudaea]MBN8888648.1 hypothetical protein [Rudaea sp.]MBR0345868.1 hypothetical protein [Rudaea sp.]